MMTLLLFASIVILLCRFGVRLVFRMWFMRRFSKRIQQLMPFLNCYINSRKNSVNDLQLSSRAFGNIEISRFMKMSQKHVLM